MKITAIRNNERFVDNNGVLTPVWGRFISGLQSNLAGEWGIQNDGNGKIFQLCGPVLHINISGISGTDPSDIDLPIECYDTPLIAVDNNIVLSNSVMVNGNKVIIPSGTYTNLHISGSAIVAQQV